MHTHAHNIHTQIHANKHTHINTQTKQEKVKVEKCGSKMWTEVHELASLIREGKTRWASRCRSL